jgi:hypothetical protein
MYSVDEWNEMSLEAKNLACETQDEFNLQEEVSDLTYHVRNLEADLAQQNQLLVGLQIDHKALQNKLDLSEQTVEALKVELERANDRISRSYGPIVVTYE